MRFAQVNFATGQPMKPTRPDIFEALQAEILEGAIRPGDRLKEADLAERFGLSRTPVREALRRLETRGLRLRIISLRHPYDPATHPIHGEIAAPVSYLPEYLWREPMRVLRAEKP